MRAASADSLWQAELLTPIKPSLVIIIPGPLMSGQWSLLENLSYIHYYQYSVRPSPLSYTSYIL